MKEFIKIKSSAFLVGLVIAGVFFLAGLFTHELIFPQPALEELKVQVSGLRQEVEKLSGEVAELAQGGEEGEETEEKAARVKVDTDDDPAMGQLDAPVVIVEFSDYQCPYCGQFVEQTLPQIEREYIETGKAQLVFRDFPLSFHQHAELAARAAQCAYEQDSFWEMHDRIFSGQGEWSGSTEAGEVFAQYAGELGLDQGEFRECLDSARYKEEVQADFDDGVGYGVSGTPTFFVNGIKLVGAQPFSAFQKVIESELREGD